MRTVFSKLFFCLALFTPIFLFGENGTPPPLLPEGEGYHYWRDFINMLVTLLFVLALIFISVWFLRRVMRSRMQQLNKTTGIRILERRPLNPKASLYLISVLGKGIVISESPSGIQPITEFPPDMNIELLLSNKEEEEKTTPSFKTVLQQKMKRIIKRDAPS